MTDPNGTLMIGEPPVEEGESCINRRPPQVSAGWLWAVLALGLILAFYGQWCFQAPQPVGETHSQFRLSNAWQHLQIISGDGQPHPPGTAAHRRVHQYLVSQLKELGYEVDVQQSEPLEYWGIRTVLKNVIARRPMDDLPEGVTDEAVRKLLFVCHYDSHPNGPGAGDDGAAVASMLELARIEMAMPAARRQVVFLFTDGEEGGSLTRGGLLGATEWVKSCDWLESIDLAFNFEGRGSSGSSFLFETSTRNAELIQQFATLAPRPTGNSLAFEVYQLMPNDTDFSVLRQAGIPGMNFAFVGDVQNYHSELDTVDNLDPHSLMHHGQTAEALLVHFRDRETMPDHIANVVYFDVASRVLLWWPYSWNWPWWAVCLLLFFVCFSCCRTGSVRDVVFGCFGWLIVMVTTGILAWIVIVGFDQQMWFDPFWGRYLPVVGTGAALAALWCVALIAWSLSGSLIECITKDKSLWLAVWGSWLLLAAASIHWLPGASFLFLIPVTAACCFRLAGHWLHLPAGKPRDGALPGWAAEPPLFTTWLPCLFAWLLWMPIQRALLAGLGYRYPILYAFLIPLMLSPAIPLVTVVPFRSKLIFMGSGLVAFAVLVMGLLLTSPGG